MSKRNWLIAISIGLIAFLHSCKEDTGNLGANVLPKNDHLGAFQWDTTSVRSSIFIKDSCPTIYSVTSLLGSYNDAIFGTAKASLGIQVTPYQGYLTATTSPLVGMTLDSVVLELPYAATYGNADPQTIKIYTLTTIPSGTLSYWSDTTVSYGSSPITTLQVNPNIIDSAGLLHMKLNIANNSWALNMFDSLSNASSAAYAQTLSTHLTGLYLIPSNSLQLPGQGGIWYLNMPSTSGGVYFYVHLTGTTDSLQTHLVLPIGSSDIYFNHFDHNFSTSAFYNHHPAGPLDSINSPAFVYVQAMAGVQGKIMFPYLKNWSKLKPVLINEAELVLPVNTQECPLPFAPCNNLFVLAIDENGNPVQTPDQALGASYFGGSYDAIDQQYTFNITLYIQNVIDGKTTDRGLYIIPYNTANGADRVVLYGGQNSTNSIKLKMYYTPLSK